jgi:hypothetical protein
MSRKFHGMQIYWTCLWCSAVVTLSVRTDRRLSPPCHDTNELMACRYSLVHDACRKRHKQDRQRTHNVTLRHVLWCLNLLGYPKSQIPFQSQRTLLWRINFAGNNKTCLGLHANPHNFCSIFTKTRKIFIKVPNIKFHGNPSCGHRADACGTDGQTWTGMMKQIGAFCDDANALQQ